MTRRWCLNWWRPKSLNRIAWERNPLGSKAAGVSLELAERWQTWIAWERNPLEPASQVPRNPHLSPLPEGRNAAPQTRSEAGLGKPGRSVERYGQGGRAAPGEGTVNTHEGIYETTSRVQSRRRGTYS